MIGRQTIHTWYWAIRPFSLSASVVPVVVGSALASQYSPFNGGLFVLILLGSLLLQSATNLIDEYADHGQDSGETKKVLAPYKVISLGLLNSRQVLYGALTCFALATLIGVYLVLRTGWPLIGVCLASLGVAYGYSAGPKPLGNMALGELIVFIFMGPVMVTSSFYVLTQTLNWTVVCVSIPVACLVTAILVVNNLRDTDEDRHSGKKTLVTLWGRRPVVWLYNSLLVMAFASIVGFVLSGVGSWIWLAPLLVLPRGIATAKMVQSGSERAVLHQAMQGTATLHLQFGLLLAIALLPTA
ncbi:MAG: 1,4-dihydroxy-2-naphthoate octaprenyltransferase [bacterium]|nr:1,4-dihydroxy-2-naphthoate octaprenyltransferase [bacterium]